jgi:LmbE family N-acetylglucosaminyl deacetylase
MLSLNVASQIGEVLCLGAHCDDVEIGCGGTLVTLARANPQLKITIAAFTSDPERAAESRAAVERLLPGVAVRLELYEHRNGYFPAEWAAIKERVEALRGSVRPDIVFTHYERDRHQDHRVLAELTWNAFRNHLILEYEIPKYDGDLGAPNTFVGLAREVVDHKIATLMRSFPSQAAKRWFTEDTFRGLMRLRGVESVSDSGFAEAFYARKLLLAP